MQRSQQWAARRRSAEWVPVVLAAALLSVGWRPPPPEENGGPPCPAGAVSARSGEELQPIVDRAAEGSTICLSAGSFAGPIVIRTRLTLQGPPEAVIQSSGEGTTLRALSDGIVLDGFTVEGSGARYDQMDAGVYVRGDSVVVRNLTLRHTLFGVVAEQSTGLSIADNAITGREDLPVGIRGDGIRLWEVRGSAIERNHLEDSRDILVWYSPGNRIAGNTVLRSRYGTHFMYSDDAVVEDNDYRGNLVGVFVMYSRGTVLRRNVIRASGGADGMGLGIKESGNLLVEGNEFLENRSCIYVDSSPSRRGDFVLVRNNLLAGCTAGVTFHSTQADNTFASNVFRSNHAQVTIEGRGNARGMTWEGNYFDDYEGYDLDRDGFGDVAYELRSLSERLVTEHPQLAFFRGTVAVWLLDLAAQVFPVLDPETLLADPRPLMSPPGGGD